MGKGLLNKIKISLSLLGSKERFRIKFLATTRILLGLLDLFGILLMGLLLSKSASQLTGSKVNLVSGNQIFDFFQELSLIKLSIATLVIFILKSVLSILFMKILSSTLAAAETEVGSDLFTRILNAPISEINQISISKIAYSLVLAPGFAITNLISTVVIILSESVLLLLILITFVFVNFQITFFVLIYFSIVGALIFLTVGTHLQKAGKTYSNSATNSNLIVEETISSIREIKVMRRSPNFVSRFTAVRKNLSHSVAMISFLAAIPRYIVEAALMLGAVGLVAFAFNSQSTSDAAATLGVFLTGSLRIMASMLPLQSALGQFRQLTSQADSFFELNNKFPKLDYDNKNPVAESTFENNENNKLISFKNVSYSYPGSSLNALNDLNFEIYKGELVAFIGPSGSGKSTIADMMAGLIMPTQGNVHISRIDSKNIKCSYVPQVPGLIHGTVEENITFEFGTKPSKNLKLNEVIKLAHLDKIIEMLPNGIQSELGAQLNSLSGGQLQRIGLARALYQDPELLILDEATSALDADTEAGISDTLRILKGKCTTIVIAHRLATVKQADRVFVVSDGEIVAEGKFADLMKSSELVARYVALSELSSD